MRDVTEKVLRLITYSQELSLDLKTEGVEYPVSIPVRGRMYRQRLRGVNHLRGLSPSRL